MHASNKISVLTVRCSVGFPGSDPSRSNAWKYVNFLVQGTKDHKDAPGSRYFAFKLLSEQSDNMRRPA